MPRPRSDDTRNIRLQFMVNKDENEFIEGVAEGLEITKPEAIRRIISFASNVDPEKILLHYEQVELNIIPEISTFDLTLENKLEKTEMPNKTEESNGEINGLDDVTQRFEKIEKKLDEMSYIIDNNSESILEIVEVIDDIIKGHNRLYNTFRTHSHLLGNVVAEVDDDREEEEDDDDEEENEEE